MSDEDSTPSDSASSPQAADTQAQPSEQVSVTAAEPALVHEEPSVPTSVPEPEVSVVPSQENTTPPPQSSPQLMGGGEEIPAQTETQTSVSESVQEPVHEPTQNNITPTTPSAAEDTHNEEDTTTPASGLPSSTEEGRLNGDIAKARAAIQDQKRKKLDKIMAKLSEKGKITNDEVEKLLRVSDATATRYLETLEKENKIKKVGTTGSGVFYEKI